MTCVRRRTDLAINLQRVTGYSR